MYAVRPNLAPNLSYVPAQFQPRSAPIAINTVFTLFSEGARKWNTKPHRACLACFQTRSGGRPSEQPCNRSRHPPQPEVGTTLIQWSAYSVPLQHRRRRCRRPSNVPFYEVVAPHLAWRRVAKGAVPLPLDTPDAGHRDTISLPRLRRPSPTSNMSIISHSRYRCAIMPMVDVRVHDCWILYSIPLACVCRLDRGQQDAYLNNWGYGSQPQAIVFCLWPTTLRDNGVYLYISPATHWFYLSCVAMMDLPLNQPVTTQYFFCTRCTLHRGPPAPTISITVDTLPVTLDAYWPLLRVIVPAHALLALESPIANRASPRRHEGM